MAPYRVPLFPNPCIGLAPTLRTVWPSTHSAACTFRASSCYLSALCVLPVGSVRAAGCPRVTCGSLSPVSAICTCTAPSHTMGGGGGEEEDPRESVWMQFSSLPHCCGWHVNSAVEVSHIHPATNPPAPKCRGEGGARTGCMPLPGFMYCAE